MRAEEIEAAEGLDAGDVADEDEEGGEDAEQRVVDGAQQRPVEESEVERRDGRDGEGAEHAEEREQAEREAGRIGGERLQPGELHGHGGALHPRRAAQQYHRGDAGGGEQHVGAMSRQSEPKLMPLFAYR